MNAELTLAIIQAILRYGPSVVVQLAKAFENNEPSVEDIKNLRIEGDPENL